jgi:hypothetical protein
MGMILRTILAFLIGWGALYAAQHYWLAAMTSRIAETPQVRWMAPAPAFPTMKTDPEKLRLAINPPLVIDTRAGQRAAIEGVVRQIDQQNRAALSHVPLPPNIPGLALH